VDWNVGNREWMQSKAQAGDSPEARLKDVAEGASRKPVPGTMRKETHLRRESQAGPEAEFLDVIAARAAGYPEARQRTRSAARAVRQIRSKPMDAVAVQTVSQPRGSGREMQSAGASRRHAARSSRRDARSARTAKLSLAVGSGPGTMIW